MQELRVTSRYFIPNFKPSKKQVHLTLVKKKKKTFETRVAAYVCGPEFVKMATFLIHQLSYLRNSVVETIKIKSLYSHAKKRRFFFFPPWLSQSVSHCLYNFFLAYNASLLL